MDHVTARGGVHVPFLDLAASYRELKDEIDAAHARVMASGRFLLGGELAAFEHDLAAYVGADHAVGVGSGFDALTLALRALSVGPTTSTCRASRRR